MNRNAFIRQGALGLFAMGLGGIPGFIARAANMDQQSRPFKKKRTLVCIFQRGAMDGLMAVCPYTDPNLKLLRPGLYMSPSSAEGSLLDLDGRFGLHPALSPFASLFTEKRMAIVHGVGSPNNSRSHFDAQDYMESGIPFLKGTASGWLNRAEGLLGQEGGPFRAVSMTNALPRSLFGENQALAISNLEDFALHAKGGPADLKVAQKSFEALYDVTSKDIVSHTGEQGFEAARVLDVNAIRSYHPSGGAKYPDSQLGNALRQIAILIKMDVGLEIAFAESGGWDTHFSQGTTNGILARNLKDFAESITAFWSDLGTWQDEVTVMTMTEFGRTVHQNGTGGTDHGRASCLFIVGNNVTGGKVYNNIRSLAPGDLEDQRDLPVTIDFRSVFSKVAQVHLRLRDDQTLFPGWKGGGLDVMRGEPSVTI
jgi:uncharacterized protein (DUF1501 family)